MSTPVTVKAPNGSTRSGTLSRGQVTVPSGTKSGGHGTESSLAGLQSAGFTVTPTGKR
jgi:hypothetical protein